MTRGHYIIFVTSANHKSHRKTCDWCVSTPTIVGNTAQPHCVVIEIATSPEKNEKGHRYDDEISSFRTRVLISHDALLPFCLNLIYGM